MLAYIVVRLFMLYTLENYRGEIFNATASSTVNGGKEGIVLSNFWNTSHGTEKRAVGLPIHTRGKETRIYSME